uniref:Putative secreted protein n=1 Tax=Anopheles darlingi TaxID=43151 RepID=A0A2M4DHI3_ANODA
MLLSVTYYFVLSRFMHVLYSRYGLMYDTNSLRTKWTFSNFYCSINVWTKLAISASLRTTSLNLSGKSLLICFTKLNTRSRHSSL